MEYTLISSTFTIKSENTTGIGLVSTNREGTKRYYHFDGLGSSAALTDADENITDTYAYSGFGTIIAVTNGSVNAFRFGGRWWYYDDGARGSSGGLVKLGIRYVEPSSGRFLSQDPIGDSRFYLLADNNVTNRIDPTGLRPILGVGIGVIFPPNPLDWGYGRYCGGNKMGPGDPIDALDRCCQAHDDCLGTFADWIIPFKRKYCDCVLAACALAACLDCKTSDCRFWCFVIHTHFLQRCYITIIIW